MSQGRQPSICLVSVIVAAHNSAAFIEPALRSALEQRGVDVEVIVVDDGSTDETAHLVLAYAQDEPRLRLVQTAKSRGPSAARNLALDEARGEWIAILDSDDEMESDRLQKLVLEGRRLDCDFIADNLKLVEFVSRRLLGKAFDTSWMNNPEPLSLNYMLLRDWPGKHPGRGIGFLKPIIKADFLRNRHLRYDEDIKTGEDMLFYARAVDAGARFYLRPEAGYLYSVRPASISAQTGSTEDLIKVNLRISELETASRAGVDFSERGRAFWYQQFSQMIKQRNVLAAFSAVCHLSPLYVGRQLAKAAARQLKCRGKDT